MGANRMVGEKAGTIVDGAFDAHKEILRRTTKAMLRPLDLSAMTASQRCDCRRGTPAGVPPGEGQFG